MGPQGFEEKKQHCCGKTDQYKFQVTRKRAPYTKAAGSDKAHEVGMFMIMIMIMICFDLEAYWAYMSIYTFQIRA